jgi:hypothetical protein
MGFAGAKGISPRIGRYADHHLPSDFDLAFWLPHVSSADSRTLADFHGVTAQNLVLLTSRGTSPRWRLPRAFQEIIVHASAWNWAQLSPSSPYPAKTSRTGSRLRARSRSASPTESASREFFVRVDRRPSRPGVDIEPDCRRVGRTFYSLLRDRVRFSDAVALSAGR